MASMRDIKRRRGSIQSTQQITKAMKLVSTVKLQHARTEAEKSKTYFDCMYETVNHILSRVGDMDHPYLVPGNAKKKAVIVITSNRGLAGGYNSNVVKLVTRHESFEKEELQIYAIGNKGREALARNGYEIAEDLSSMAEAPAFRAVMELCERLLALFQAGEIGEIYLAYTSFKNTVSHEPTLLRLLPVQREYHVQEDSVRKNLMQENQVLENNGQEHDSKVLMNFEPVDEEALNMIIPKYISSLIYGGLKEAIASENGARMQAMDNATSNAEEMISDLTLKYNRARQGSITQELTEIIAGAEAIS